MPRFGHYRIDSSKPVAMKVGSTVTYLHTDHPSILRDMLGSAAALPTTQQLSKCNRLALFRAARFVILTVRQRHPLSFPRFVVSAIFFTLAMNLCNFLLISHQDSLARVIVPSVCRAPTN